jgi:hypothetical protein
MIGATLFTLTELCRSSYCSHQLGRPSLTTEMPESLVTKRLHISGLTPSITPGDLERRLSSFGTVKAMDGFGAQDALGDPRKFAYVTMEIGPKELAKCEFGCIH